MDEHDSNNRIEELDEEQLILNARKDLREFKQLYLRYVQPVYRYIYSRIQSSADAEDATAQTFLSALEGFSHYKHDGHFAAWLFSIARRKTADIFRKQRREEPLNETTPDDEEEMLTKIMKLERSERLKAIISVLPAEDAELLRLRFAAGLNFNEIALLVNRSEDAVKKNLYRLLDRIQERMEESHE